MLAVVAVLSGQNVVGQDISFMPIGVSLEETHYLLTTILK
jgi:hypothetical protein